MKTTINFADFTCLHGFALACFVMVILAWMSGNSSSQEDVVRVAMIGNSIMYYNDLPRLLQAMSGGRLQQDSCLHGDASLESHLVYGNGMLEKWNTGQARMWDVDEKEAAQQYYYDIYYPYYNSGGGGDDDAYAGDDGSRSSSSSSSYSQTVDQSFIYDYGACTVEQLLLGYDERFAEIYEEESNQYYTDDASSYNNNNNNRRTKTRHDQRKRRRKKRRQLENSTAGRSLSKNSTASWNQRSRERQQKDLLRQLSGTMRQKEVERKDPKNRQSSSITTLFQQFIMTQDVNASKINRVHNKNRRIEDAGDDNVAADDDDDDDQASAGNDDDGNNANGDDNSYNDDAAAANDNNRNDDDGANSNADDDYYSATAATTDDDDDAYYTSTDDGTTDDATTYDDDYYQDTYDEEYPLQDDGTNPCMLSANYYFFKQRQYDDFGPPQWDYVLINDNSRGPCCTEARATGLELLEDVYVPWLRESKAVPIFMVTHSYWSSIRDMSGLTDVPTFLSLTYEGYREYADAVGKALPANQQPRIAPVGLAFLLVWEENRSMWYNLIHQDEIHLTPTGTYLEGLIVYASIYGHLPSPQIVLNGDIANLFSNARRMTPQEHVQEAYPTLDQARYLYHVARRIMDGDRPKSFIKYENGESADFVPDDEPYKNNQFRI